MHGPETRFGWLDVPLGHRIHWQATGAQDGRPLLVVHGGPGSGSSASTLRHFDAKHLLVVQFDQRGCGRSEPHAGDPGTTLDANATPGLIDDIERLRLHLGLERWLVFGSSWGSTLALAYAQAHPSRVEGLILAGVTMTRPSEIDWLYRGLRLLFPAEWARFAQGIEGAEEEGRVVAAYRERLEAADPAVRAKAAADWHAWEALTVTSDPDAPPPARWADPRYRLARARICAHFFHHRAWLEDGQLLRDAAQLAGIPGALAHGRLDLAAPLRTAWELAQAWPGAVLDVVPGAGHAAGEPGMEQAIARALARFT